MSFQFSFRIEAPSLPLTPLTALAPLASPASALYAVTIMEFSLFTLTGIVVYYYCGQYSGAPAVVVLKPVFKKIAFAFVLPTTIIIGVIYASVVAKYLFNRLFYGTRHYVSGARAPALRSRPFLHTEFCFFRFLACLFPIACAPLPRRTTTR